MPRKPDRPERQSLITESRKQMVLGFCFSPPQKSVVLIRKNRPAWQNGLWNGIGGDVEGNETPVRAIAREFLEEAGLLLPCWELFAIIHNPTWMLHCFKNTHHSLDQVRTKTDEQVSVWKVADALVSPLVIHNLKWMLPLATDPCISFPVCVTDLGKS